MKEDIIEHYGVARRSGRYPWGSGKRQQRSYDIITRIDKMRSQGLSEKEIAEQMGFNTTQLRSEIALANQYRKEALVMSAHTMAEDGKSVREISERLGVAPNSVRSYLNTDLQSDKVRAKQIDNIANALKEGVDKTGYLDVGAGSNLQLGISEDKMKKTIKQLESEGYYVHEVMVKQLNSNNWTIVKTLTKEPDIDEVKKHKDDITTLEGRTDDGGTTIRKFKAPESLDISKVGIRYGDEGGEDRDGLIQVRPGAEGLSLGNSHYAQVRIKIGDDMYAKGMAVIDHDATFPPGKDIIFNTNKPRIDEGTGKQVTNDKVFKKVKDNSGDPMKMFGSNITDQKGKMNIVSQEGDWDSWDGSKFSSQFLSKQPLPLIRERLSETYDKAAKDLDEILSIPNPVVRKKLLEQAISDADAKQTHLKAQGIPHTKAHVLVPFPDIKENMVYAPNYRDGDKVVLVRYPHAGTFELAELTVNNRMKTPKKVLGNVPDAIGIHPSVAKKLSGADFDGDTAYVIPNNSRKVKTSQSLKGLKDFDPNDFEVAPGPDGKRPMTITPRQKQQQMGMVSNLITDMTIRGASAEDLTRAVKHSMVVIDSEKHKLDWKKSEQVHGIPALKKKYQGRINAETGRYSEGASTLVSKSRQKTPTKTETYIGKDGKKRTKILKEEYKIHLTKDANELSSGSAVEREYATYVNKMKSLSNKAQKSYATTPGLKANPAMTKRYKNEVDSLNAKLKVAQSNAPRERQAQLMAEKLYRQQVAANPEMTKDQLKRVKNQSLVEARTRAGASLQQIKVTPKEWEAIDNEAISGTRLSEILRYSDMDTIRELATPRKNLMTPAKASRARSLLARGYTPAEVADALGISVSYIRLGL